MAARRETTGDRGKAIPLHRQIERTLADEIRSGILPAGGALPGEPDLARRFGVSRMTVREALRDLAEQGLLIRRHGRRTQVAAEPVAQPLGGFYAFVSEMDRLGREHQSRVLRAGLVRPSARVRATLGLGDGETAAQITLVRLLGAEPLMVETATFLAALLPILESDEVTHRSLYDLIATAGVVVTRAVEQIGAVALTVAQARLLETAARRPGFLVRRTSYAGAIPIEVRESVVRGDRYSFVADLRRHQLTGALN